MYYLWGEEDENKEEYGWKCLVEYSACGEPSHFAMSTIKEMTRSTHSLCSPENSFSVCLCYHGSFYCVWCHKIVCVEFSSLLWKRDHHRSLFPLNLFLISNLSTNNGIFAIISICLKYKFLVFEIRQNVLNAYSVRCKRWNIRLQHGKKDRPQFLQFVCMKRTS